ncbi:MAG: hypothetical protein HY287_14480 [Planctomycetes bacterium]|nr:hypothetical protein [Planctomycetota bacterium]MBI3835529.1 hypothetical protein [Planctomycetota bacterium]
MKSKSLFVAWLAAVAISPFARAEEKTDDVVMRAMVDEVDRAKDKLMLEGLPKSYFIQAKTEDRETYSLSASYGGLERSAHSRSRIGTVRSRVGSTQLDNTNFRGSFGAGGILPIEDDYKAIRCAFWLFLDQDYKRAVENLTQKIAYLKEKSVSDRPDDFSAAPPAVESQPRPKFDFDVKKWEQTIVRLSSRFKDQPRIKDARVSMMAGSSVEWLVNSEGTRLRTTDTGAQIEIRAEIQATDGMPITDSRSYIAERLDQLPTMEKMLGDIEEMCRDLISTSEASILQQYTGPILFEAHAAGSVFDSLLSNGLAARPIPLGSGEDSDQSLEKKIGLRILPRSFSIYDDAGPKELDGKALAGAYDYDDEGVKPQRVSLVERGILKTLVSGREPTKAVKQSNGHGRASGFGDPRAVAGCLYVSTDQPLSADELKQELLQSARDEGLPFALRIKSIREGEAGGIGNPVRAFKVFVEDGHEEPIRGAQFKPVEVRSLKRLLAAGGERKAFNTTSPVSASVIAPAIVFEELELTKIEGEFDKLPILPSPLVRGKTPSANTGS